MRPDHDVDLSCVCPDGATLDEMIMIGGHWPDCPRHDMILIRLGTRSIPVDEISEHFEIESAEPRSRFFPRRDPGTPRPVPFPSPHGHS